MKNHKIIRVHAVKNDGTISVVIPKEIRKKLRIVAGDYLVVESKNDKVIFKKVDLK